MELIIGFIVACVIILLMLANIVRLMGNGNYPIQNPSLTVVFLGFVQLVVAVACYGFMFVCLSRWLG